MNYSVLLSQDAQEYLLSLDEKSKIICKKNVQKLAQHYPGRGIGDKEKIVVSGEEMYRLHIGRTHTAFYIIDERTKHVRVLEILSIESAHKKYGF